MNRPLFHPEHLRIAAEVRAKCVAPTLAQPSERISTSVDHAVGVVFPFMLARIMILLLGQ